MCKYILGMVDDLLLSFFIHIIIHFSIRKYKSRIYMKFALYWGILDERKFIKKLCCYEQIYNCINLNFVYLLRLWWGNLNLEFGALVCNFYTIYNYTTSFIPFSTQKRSWIDINYQYYMCDCKDVRIHSVITLNLCRTLRVIILSLRTVLLFMRLCGSRYIWTKIIMRETKKYRTLGDLWTILQARCPKGRIRFQWVLNWEKRNRKWFASTMFLCAFLGVCSDFLPVAPAIVFRASLSNELFQSRWYM